MRDYCRLDAERRMLAALFYTAEVNDQPPYKWLDALKQARTTPEYRKISEQLEPSLVALEESLEQDELARLIESIPPTDFPS